MKPPFLVNAKDALFLGGNYYCMNPEGLRRVLFELRTLGYALKHRRYSRERGDYSIAELEALPTPMWTCLQSSLDAAVCKTCGGIIDTLAIEDYNGMGRPCEFCGAMTMQVVDGHIRGTNYRHVKFWRGTVYDGDGGSNPPPVPEFVSVYEAWRWAPLPLSDTLPQQVRGVCGINSRRDWYHHGERMSDRQHLVDMNVFMTRLTQVDPDECRRRMAVLGWPARYTDVWDTIEELCRP